MTDHHFQGTARDALAAEESAERSVKPPEPPARDAGLVPHPAQSGAQGIDRPWPHLQLMYAEAGRIKVPVDLSHTRLNFVFPQPHQPQVIHVYIMTGMAGLATV